jgi:cholesterol oxidase
VANLSVFAHLARTARRGKLVDNRGRNAYLPNVDRWSMPTTLLSGAENDCFLPVSTQQTIDYLGSGATPPELVRHEVPDYGHIDVFLGHSAWRDVYPLVTEHLEGVG